MAGITELDILVIEDDALQRKALFDLLTAGHHRVKACEYVADAEKLLEKESFDLILSDMKLADGNGLEFLGRQKEKGLKTPVVIITAFADIHTAVHAIKLGASDYLPKPFKPELLNKIIANVAQKITMSRQIETLSRMTMSDYDNVWQFDKMIGTDEVLRPIFEKAQKIAGFPDTTVLILGESGTGKGMLAKAIHRFSKRAEKPFIDINCSAIPGQLMESEIFGYERGAFTDAKNAKPGLFEVADGGTVFLDEIGDMEPALQSKLLKVIEDKELGRLGGGKTTSVDVRILAATSRDLKAMVRENKFRADLYYRLSVIPIVLPPLREQRSCIAPLANYFLKQFSHTIGHTLSGFEQEAMKMMMEYSWPGNIRELKNAIERSVILASGNEITADALGLKHASVREESQTESQEEKTDPGTGMMSLADGERKLIEAALKSAGGNKNRAADMLKIHRTTLYKKIEEYGIT